MTNDELESLREKRKQELLAQSLKKELEQKEKEKELLREKDRQVKASMIVNKVLEDDAKVYLEWLSRTNPVVAHTIKETIIMLIYKNLLKKNLSKLDLMKIERELTGQESSIQVKRRGREKTDLNSNIKKTKEEYES
ncbi:MAG: hypothetical protein ACFFDW_09070 [Candidatus Thorarchaeota archaeon]